MTSLATARRIVRGVAQGAASQHFGLYYPTPQEVEEFVRLILDQLIATNPTLLPTSEPGSMDSLLDAAAEGVEMRFENDVRIVLSHRGGLRLHAIQPIL